MHSPLVVGLLWGVFVTGTTGGALLITVSLVLAVRQRRADRQADVETSTRVLSEHQHRLQKGTE